MLVCSSPRLIAAYHVLHRLSDPRHPPCALIRFKKFEIVVMLPPLLILILLMRSLSQYVKELTTSIPQRGVTEVVADVNGFEPFYCLIQLHLLLNQVFVLLCFFCCVAPFTVLFVIEPDPEVSDTTADAICNAAGYQLIF